MDVATLTPATETVIDAQGVIFAFAFARAWSGAPAPDPFFPEPGGGVDELVHLRYVVHDDGSWMVEAGLHPSLGDRVDTTLHRITGDSATPASEALRQIATLVTALRFDSQMSPA